MKKSIRNIIAISVIVIPFYLAAILEKAFGEVDFSIDGIFGMYLLYTFLGLLTIYFTNKYLLNKNLKVFASSKGSFIIDISLAFLLLIFIFFIMSLGNITYGRWLPTDPDRENIVNILKDIFSDPTYTIFLLGPFIWVTEGFMAISRAFILNNLWELKPNKTWAWTSIVITAMFCSLVQINNGIPGMLNWFFIFLATNTLYYKYRRVYPIIIAGILLQTIELIGFWVYVL